MKNNEKELKKELSREKGSKKSEEYETLLNYIKMSYEARD